ncbi:unnamed protein product [Caenorhabditis sp. 36 PRJEB53466]|nr:unnamed protein product [Caenorhabditis sp. 36 PRJEB53466]
MEPNNVNWYSTNSIKRYQNTIVSDRHTTSNDPAGHVEHAERVKQFSDEGRIPLGNFDDPENVEAREELLRTVPEEVLNEWDAFKKDMREKSSVTKRLMGIPTEEVDAKFRTFPEKKKHEWDAEATGISGDSQTWRENYRSRFVLNRKVKPLATTSSAPSPHSDSQNNDAIFVDASNSSSKTNFTRWIASIDSEPAPDQSAKSPKRPQITVPEPTPTTSKSEKSPSTFKESSLSQTAPIPPVRECILYKYGHCLDPKVCKYSHNGEITKVPGKTITPVFWQRKLPSTPICPGYANLSCWDTNCSYRHIAYPSDKF